jgi:hypothetical protein
LANWIKKEDPTICYLLETHLMNRNKHWLRVRGWKKIQEKTPKRNNNYQSICTLHQHTQFHQTYSEGPKNIYKLQHSDSGRP